MTSLATISILRLYTCICQLEGGKGYQLGGAACIQPSLWSEYTNLPYSFSDKLIYCKPVCLDALIGIQKHLTSHNIPFTPATAYWVWRKGLTAFLSDLAHHRTYEGAERCMNLYYEHTPP